MVELYISFWRRVNSVDGICYNFFKTHNPSDFVAFLPKFCCFYATYHIKSVFFTPHQSFLIQILRIVTQAISQIRRRNLMLQINLFIRHALDSGQETGAVTDFAEKIGIHKSLLSKLKGEGQSSRDVSDALAAQIEVALGLPKGWMDTPHDEAPPTPAETSFMELALQAYRATDARGRTQLRRSFKSMITIAQEPKTQSPNTPT